MMANERNPSTDLDEPMKYAIRLQGHLGRELADWFAGLSVTLEENGSTRLTGPVSDQAALHGLLKKVRDLGIPLLAVYRIEPGQPGAPDGSNTRGECS